MNSQLFRTFKLLLLGITLFLFSNTELYATHAMGADLTYSCIGNGQYRIRLQFYRDCNGINATNTVTVRVASPGCQSLNITLNRTSLTEVTPVCPGIIGTACNGGGGQFGIQLFVYEGVVTLPSTCTDWTFSWRLCCRNAAISTLNNPTGEQMQLVATLNTAAASCNNSPVFLNDPIPFVCNNQAVFYNHGASDSDGDQLRYSLTPCLDSLNTPVSYNSAAGFSGTNPMATSTGVSINPNTGALTFTPNAVQVGVICVLVEELRNGQVIGSIVRDIQFTVVNCVNQVPALTGMNGTNLFLDTAVIGQQYCFTVNSSDPDTGQTLTINYNNSLNGATFSQAGAPFPVGTFCWTPTLADTGLNNITLQVVDNYCPIVGQNTYTYSIYVAPPTPVNTCTVTVALGPTSNLVCTNNDGTAEIIVTGGTQPYTISVINWTTGEVFTNSTGIFTNLTAGNYSVFVADAAGCQPDCSNLNFSILGNIKPLIVKLIAADLSCFNSNDGKITVDVTGGNPSYLYSIGNGFQSSNLFTGLAAGTYLVTVIDSLGCSATDSVTINAPSQLNVTTNNVFQPTCGRSNGGFTIIAVGGVSPYTYAVNGQPSSDVVTNLGNGIYTIDVTDANGCISSTLIGLQGTPAINLTVSSTNLSCFNGCNGSITTSTNGSRLTYIWSNGEQTASINNICAGIYTVTASDANGCTTSATVTITQPAELVITSSNIVQPSCGNSNGSFDITATGGTAPYTYTINGLGVTNTQIQGLPNGVYTVGVQDANGCQSTTVVTLNGSSTFTIRTTSTNVTCNGACDGFANVSSTTTNLSYVWSNGQTGDLAANLCAGTYTVSATDAAGCQVTSTVLITEPGAIQLSLATSTDETCAGNDGTATVAVTGGSAPYTFNLASVSNGTVVSSNTGVFTGLNAGYYAFNVTDANGCNEQCLGTFQINYNCNTTGNLTNNTNQNITSNYLMVNPVETQSIAQIKYFANNQMRVNIQIIDQNSKQITQFKDVTNKGNIELNATTWNKGTYFVILSDLSGKVISTSRLVKK